MSAALNPAAEAALQRQRQKHCTAVIEATADSLLRNHAFHSPLPGVRLENGQAVDFPHLLVLVMRHRDGRTRLTDGISQRWLEREYWRDCTEVLMLVDGLHDRAVALCDCACRTTDECPMTVEAVYRYW